MDSVNESESEITCAITQSEYILAKYRIQVIDKDKIPPVEHTEEVLGVCQSHETLGPKALEHNPKGGKLRCNLDTAMQLMWCCWLPCYLIGQCFIGFAERCCDALSRYSVYLEEHYTFKWCCCKCCELDMK